MNSEDNNQLNSDTTTPNPTTVSTPESNILSQETTVNPLSAPSAQEPISAQPAQNPAKGMSIVGLVMAFIFSPAGIVISAIALMKSKKLNNKNNIALIGLITSICILIISILGTIVIINLFKSDDAKGLLVQFSNQISQDTEAGSGRDYLSGFDWEMSDDSILSLNTNGTYKWSQTLSEDSDYYAGTYSVISGDAAITKVDNEIGFDESYFERETNVLRQDIMYLTLNKTSAIVDGNSAAIPESAKETNYIFFFTIEDKDTVGGVNIKSMNEISLIKLN